MTVALEPVAERLRATLAGKQGGGTPASQVTPSGRIVVREKERRLVLSHLQDGSVRLELFTGTETIPRRESWGSDEEDAYEEGLTLLRGPLPPRHNLT